MLWALVVLIPVLLGVVDLQHYVCQKDHCSNINYNDGKIVLMTTTTTTATANIIGRGGGRSRERKRRGKQSMFLQPTHDGSSIFVMAADIFMMGNSYTSANSLPTMIQDLFRNTNGGNGGGGTGGRKRNLDNSGGVSGSSRNCSNDNNTTPTSSDATVTQQQPAESSSSKNITIDVQAPGGWKIYQHANQITSSSSSTMQTTTMHSQMLNATTQFVILQDQSQVYV